MNKKVMVFLFVLLGLIGLVQEASAASVLDAGMKTAIDTGFTDLQDTVRDVISVSWKWILGIAALLLSPSLVMRMISVARGGK